MERNHYRWKEIWLVIDGDTVQIQKRSNNDKSIVIHNSFPISQLTVYSISKPHRMLRIVHQAFNDKIVNYDNMFNTDFTDEIIDTTDITIELRCTLDDTKSTEHEEEQIKALMNIIEWNQYIATTLNLQSPR